MKKEKYGSSVKVKVRGVVEFEDFSLTYLGKRHVTNEKFKLGFDFYDFEIMNKSEKSIVSWSSGTGEIAPRFFEINRKKFRMELLGSNSKDSVILEIAIVS